MKWVEMTRTHNEAGTFIKAEQSTWHKSSEECQKREDILAQTEELQEHVQDAAKARIELTEGFDEWLAISSEAKVVMEAKKLQEADLRHCFERDAAAWGRGRGGGVEGLTGKKTASLSENMWTGDPRKENKNMVHDWDAIINAAVKNGRNTEAEGP